ncbi:MAG: hypothetical protein WAP53_08595 [Dysgonamonadaceae bacterium]|uniref:hypothetical protein n=1 Tax=Clostridium sp. N3C TaxID=1776758 RepID=UPI00092E0732|nr:hypothetical protein [Clostridium sp. N3C]SCN26645.1 hypothetical protein N3C_2946 [Clostridium sp. N3C]
MKRWSVYIVTLLILNINSLVYGVVSSYYRTTFQLWSLSHYLIYCVLLFLASKIIITTVFKSKFVKNVFISSFIISFFTLILGWYLTSLKVKSTVFICILISQLASEGLSFFMTLYCKRHSFINKDDITSFSFEDGVKYGLRIIMEENSDEEYNKRIMQCTTFTPIILILIIILYIIIPNILKRSNNRINIILFSIPIIFGFILINNYRNRLYYKKNKYIKKAIFETILILTGIAFLFYFEGFVYYKTYFINFYVLVIPIAMLYSVLDTNYKVSKEYIRIINQKKKQE